jgi:enoyl-[acyl-carrier protein] reductase I
MGVANSNSIAWGIASQLAAQGAELAFTYLGEGLERRVRPLAESVGAKLLIQADVTDDASMDAAFAELEKEFGTIDFVVHSVAFANKDELKGSFVDNTSRDSFLLAMNISAFSFVDVAKRASKLMPNGGSLVTMTYLGSERAIPNYNTMGVAKAALEAATRYIARDLGPKGIRCNAISAGAMRTLSLAGISGGRGMLSQGRALFDPIERRVARAAEDGELGHLLVADHGVVAPFPGGDHPPIDPQHQPQLLSIKEDRTGLLNV